MAEAQAPQVPKSLGRKTKRTPSVEGALFLALREGCTRRAACAAAGISHDTLYAWINEFPDFSDAVTRAEYQAEVGFTRVIQKAATEGDWKAAESWLKRRRKDDWSERTETTGPDGGPVPVAFQFVPYAGPDTDNP